MPKHYMRYVQGGEIRVKRRVDVQAHGGARLAPGTKQAPLCKDSTHKQWPGIATLSCAPAGCNANLIVSKIDYDTTLRWRLVRGIC